MIGTGHGWIIIPDPTDDRSNGRDYRRMDSWVHRLFLSLPLFFSLKRKKRRGRETVNAISMINQ